MTTKKLSSKGRKVLQYRRKNPNMRTSEIGKLVGLTRERVRQLLKEAGLSTRVASKPQRYCSICEKPVSGETITCRPCIQSEAWITVLCATCGGDKAVRKSTHRYRQKEESNYNNKYYCNRECFYNRPDPFGKESNNG